MQKQNILKIVISAGLLNLLPGFADAQHDSTTLLLPDNRVLAADKLDSLRKAWGGPDRVAFAHSEEDDKKGILRLQRVTDEDIRLSIERDAARRTAQLEMTGKPAPGWEVKDINGRSWSLQSLRGKVVVMNSWFTTCSPCIKEMPHLNKLEERYKSDDVVFIAFTFNDAETVRGFLAKRPFNFIQVADAEAVNEAYGTHAWPTSFVIDRNGILRLVLNYDPQVDEKLAAAIEEARGTGSNHTK